MKPGKNTVWNRIRRKLSRWIACDPRVEQFFTLPFRFFDQRGYIVNERIIEMPFIFSELGARPGKLKILDVGCTNSWLSISLASLGHEVYGVDMRSYSFSHPNLVFFQGDVLNLKETGFDAVVALSTLEHVGLGAYGEEKGNATLELVLDKLHHALLPSGRLLITVPAGQPESDSFQRTFAPEEIEGIVSAHNFHLLTGRYFRRHENVRWTPCTADEILCMSNRRKPGQTESIGSNGVACLMFQKKASHPDVQT